MNLTELIGIAIGGMLVALGLASVGGWSLRRRPAEGMLLFFGVWCVIYGARLVAQQPPARAALGGDHVWIYVVAFLTYAINVPGGMFVEALIGAGWKGSVRRTWQLQALFAVVAIAVGVLLERPLLAMAANGPVVLAGIVVAFGNTWVYRGRLAAPFRTVGMTVAVIGLVVLVVNENIGRPLVPTVGLEPIGVIAFVVALAYGVAADVFRGEAELLAVTREMSTARQIQTSLLPREPPAIRGLDLAVRYLPMTAVAGDLYDFVVLGPTSVGILVADVSGHGVPAALVASMVKLAFAEQHKCAGDPAQVMAGMNRTLCRHVERSFVTAIYLVVDTDRRQITFANAGHPPLLIGRGASAIAPTNAHGVLLGFLPDAAYENASVALEDHDRILVYTDGVLETRNRHGDFFDQERVFPWLSSVAAGSARELADVALDSLDAWRAGAPVEDDLTLVVGRFNAQPRG